MNGGLGSSLTTALSGLRWYLRAVSGESRWDDHLERCRREGIEPMTRRAFERHRDEHREQAAAGRCC